ncbi:MAG: peptide deformylase [Burkholderiaceae bacterium]
MSVLNILHYPDPRLHKIAAPVQQVDARIRRLIDDMADTMYEAPGIGLAATQVDVHERVIVIDVSDDKSNLQVFVNPVIVSASESRRSYDEGCLSVPDIYDAVERPEEVTVRALDRDGKAFEMACAGLLAVCIQHEIDHLEGKVFVQYLSRLKQGRIRAKMLKRDRQVS